MIDHATAFKYTRIQLEVTAWGIICITKRKNKQTKKSLKVIHDYVLLPRCLVFTVLCYMELFGRSRSNSFVYTVIKMRQTLMDSKKRQNTV